MKNKWHFFSLFMIFILPNGFGQQNSGNFSDGVLERRLYPITGGNRPQESLSPLTFDDVKLIESNGMFNNLDYYLSSDLVLTILQERKVRANSGGLVIDNGKTVEARLPVANPGEFVRFDSKTHDEVFLTIKFPGIVQALHFVRDPKTNRFSFYGVANSHASYKSPAPYLCIHKTGASSQSSAAEPPPRPALQVDTATWRSSVSRVPAGLPAAADQIPVYIMGNGRLSRNLVVSYIVNKGSSMNRQRIDELVGDYIREAGEEGVNHDIAIAQMCYATWFLNNQRLIATHNYAGLNTDMGISARGSSRHFNPTEGVRAHIQHLKGYASTVQPQKDIVDRRYDLLGAIRGTVQTLDDLFAAWSPYNAQNYGYEIRKILRELYQFSE
ncbi:MAG: glucosaminidase domain-containing protein [Treponema sp.]|jgi:hypothetical protein|nr:glucosaminidase domain-containing protein [Treponema sp.]